MKKLFYIICISVILTNCSKDDDLAHSFTGKQEIEIFLDDLPPIIYKGGEFFESLNQNNSDFTGINYYELGFSFSMEKTNMFEKFAFGFQEVFNFTTEQINNPFFFSANLEFTDEYSDYKLPQSSGNGHGVDYLNIGSEDSRVDSVNLNITEFHSNGNEKVIDGVRQAYPLEKIKGNLEFSYKNDLNGKNHKIKVNFDFEGKNIIKEDDEIIITTPSGENDLIGKWYQIPQTCNNSSGERNFLHFKSGGKLTTFQADCNSACAGGGVTIEMDYEVSGNKIIHTPRSVSEYCGQQAATPTPFTVTYSISTNGTLTIDGNQQWKK